MLWISNFFFVLFAVPIFSITITTNTVNTRGFWIASELCPGQFHEAWSSRFFFPRRPAVDNIIVVVNHNDGITGASLRFVIHTLCSGVVTSASMNCICQPDVFENTSWPQRISQKRKFYVFLLFCQYSLLYINWLRYTVYSIHCTQFCYPPILVFRVWSGQWTLWQKC